MSRKGVKAESWALVRGVGEGVHHEWGLERGELFFEGSWGQGISSGGQYSREGSMAMGITGRTGAKQGGSEIKLEGGR